jgi:hypothetical protein
MTRAALLTLIVLAACSDDVGPDLALDALGRDGADAGKDAEFADASLDAGADLGSERDASAPVEDLGGGLEAGPSDGEPTDRGDPLDAGELADASEDRDLSADAGCDYLDLDIIIVKCAGGYEYARGFADLNGQCPGYYELRGNTAPTLSGVIQDAMCDPTCEYRARTSVSFIDPCGRRNGYIIYGTPDDELCPPQYEFAEGLFPSREAWEKVLNCGG